MGVSVLKIFKGRFENLKPINLALIESILAAQKHTASQCSISAIHMLLSPQQGRYTGARSLQNLLGFLIEVGEPPLMIQRKKGIGNPFEDIDKFLVR